MTIQETISTIDEPKGWLKITPSDIINLNDYCKKLESENKQLILSGVINWVAVCEKLPTRMDEDYLVCVRNKNKEGGIPIQDIGNFSSDGVWVKQNTWEDVVYWAELPEPPCL